MSKNPAPSTLSDAGRALWSSIAGKYELRPDEVSILTLACETADMLAILDAAWVDAGKPFLTKGSMGQEVIHPLVGERRQQSAQQAALLARLKLPDDATGGAGTGETNQHRAAAQSKWAQAHGKGA